MSRDGGRADHGLAAGVCDAFDGPRAGSHGSAQQRREVAARGRLGVASRAARGARGERREHRPLVEGALPRWFQPIRRRNGRGRLLCAGRARGLELGACDRRRCGGARTRRGLARIRRGRPTRGPRARDVLGADRFRGGPRRAHVGPRAHELRRARWTGAGAHPRPHVFRGSRRCSAGERRRHGRAFARSRARVPDGAAVSEDDACGRG